MFQFLLHVNGQFWPNTWVIQQKIITCIKSTHVTELILRNGLMSQSGVAESAVPWQMLFLALRLFWGFLEASYFTMVLHSERETPSPDVTQKIKHSKTNRNGTHPCRGALPCLWSLLAGEKTTAEFGFRVKSGENTGTRDAQNGKLSGSSKNLNTFFLWMYVFNLSTWVVELLNSFLVTVSVRNNCKWCFH